MAWAVLLAAFWAVYDASYQAAFSAKATELRTALSILTADPAEAVDPGDIRNLNPPVSVEIFSPDGKLVNSAGPRVTVAFGRLVLGSRPSYSSDGQAMFVARPFRGQVVVVAGSWLDSARGLESLRLILVVIWLPMGGLIGLSAYLASGAIFKPLERLSVEADAIGGADLRQRLAAVDRHEFGEFAARLNRMLDRIQRTVEREERFTADAAHELRTPLAILRTRIETTLLRRRTVAAYEEALRELLGEVDRLSLVVTALLKTARGQALETEGVEASAVVFSACERWREAFASEGVSLVVKAVDCRVMASSEELEVVLDNLLDNARRFAPSGTSVVVELGSDGMLSVEDSGPGVPPELLDHVFDRFVRGEDSRNRASGGLGIGLTLVKRIVEGRGGSVSVRNAPGARFSVAWPSVILP